MISEALLQRIAAQFPELPVLTDSVVGAAMTIPGRHPGVGALAIQDDGSEATVAIGEITHGHFSDFREDASAQEKAHAIADSVVAFLRLLFADRVLLWRSGQSGGWRVLEGDEVPTVHSDAGTQFYVWSGPISD